MNKATQVVRWLARILSGLILVFVGGFTALYLAGGQPQSSQPLTSRDTGALVTGVVLLAGLAIGWKWELLGGAIALVGCLVLGALNGTAFEGLFLLIPLTALLFLASGWMGRQHRAKGTSDDSDASQRE